MWLCPCDSLNTMINSVDECFTVPIERQFQLDSQITILSLRITNLSKHIMYVSLSLCLCLRVRVVHETGQATTEWRMCVSFLVVWSIHVDKPHINSNMKAFPFLKLRTTESYQKYFRWMYGVSVRLSDEGMLVCVCVRVGENVSNYSFDAVQWPSWSLDGCRLAHI